MAANNPNTDDLSFLEKKDANALSGKDIVITIVRNLHWILLCAVIGAAIAWYRSDRADRIYESHAKILISSITRNRLDNGMSMLENITNRRVATTMNAISRSSTLDANQSHKSKMFLPTTCTPLSGPKDREQSAPSSQVATKIRTVALGRDSFRSSTR